ncbi:nuclease domain-containing protein [Dyella japonica]|uniref:DUF1364 domain-containing protein n=1 Tax=Dyella japonica TaxID=231455 RepID=A0ABV2JZ11_9GAMM
MVTHLTPLRKSAKGEDCTLNVAGVCNYDPSTTVLCHLPIIESAGMGQKATDLCACYGCNACHDWIDNRNGTNPYDERLFYAARGLVRTQRRMIEKGLIVVKGIAA